VTTRRSGAVMSALALAGLAISAYLAWAKLTGGLPACGPLHGCETVAASEYSELFGIPVAVYGTVFSTILSALAIVWWRRGRRPALLAAYGLGLLGVIVVAGLTYLELFVIHAICAWCATYALTVLAGWLAAVAALRAA
jgi:uncharacterized membrane protein